MKRVAVALIRGYQRWISPLLGPACRYTPTCSQFAVEALEMHGTLKGTALATCRLLRCHPLAKGGFDPVPRPSSAPAGGRPHSAA